MLIIKPVEEKEQQKQFADACGIPYRTGDFAYAAYVDGIFTALSQFRVCDTHGILDDLVLVPASNDVEALFILGRQTLNWIDLLGIHACKCSPNAAPERVLRVMGFVPAGEENTLIADMTHMFDGHCGGHCDIARELREP